MIRRILTCTMAALLIAGGAPAQPDSAKAVRGNAPAADSLRRGNLFSAVLFGDSAFGAEWARLRAPAAERFPDLKLTGVPDLHVTVVYIGAGWQTGDLDRIRAHALVVPAAPVRLTPEVVPLGRDRQVVAVELHPESPAWGDSVVAAKATLNRLGLKKPEGYDANFRAHVTLARARHNPPTPADSAALDGFRSWMAGEVGREPGRFAVTVGPRTRVRLLLAGAGYPREARAGAADAPEYVPVEEFLARQRTAPRAD